MHMNKNQTHLSSTTPSPNYLKKNNIKDFNNLNFFLSQIIRNL